MDFSGSKQQNRSKQEIISDLAQQTSDMDQQKLRNKNWCSRKIIEKYYNFNMRYHNKENIIINCQFLMVICSSKGTLFRLFFFTFLLKQLKWILISFLLHINEKTVGLSNSFVWVNIKYPTMEIKEKISDESKSCVLKNRDRFGEHLTGLLRQSELDNGVIPHQM